MPPSSLLLPPWTPFVSSGALRLTADRSASQGVRSCLASLVAATPLDPFRLLGSAPPHGGPLREPGGPQLPRFARCCYPPGPPVLLAARKAGRALLDWPDTAVVLRFFNERTDPGSRERGLRQDLRTPEASSHRQAPRADRRSGDPLQPGPQGRQGEVQVVRPGPGLVDAQPDPVSGCFHPGVHGRAAQQGAELPRLPPVGPARLEPVQQLVELRRAFGGRYRE